MTPRTIRDILGDRRLFTVSPDTPLRDVARDMSQNKVGAVVVVEYGHLVGILSERDIVFRAAAEGLSMAETTAREIMTPDPVTIDIGNALSQALLSRLGDQFRHLPVTEDGVPVGVLSYRDIPAEYVMMFERFREMTNSRADDAP